MIAIEHEDFGDAFEPGLNGAFEAVQRGVRVVQAHHGGAQAGDHDLATGFNSRCEVVKVEGVEVALGRDVAQLDGAGCDDAEDAFRADLEHGHFGACGVFGDSGELQDIACRCDDFAGEDVILDVAVFRGEHA